MMMDLEEERLMNLEEGVERDGDRNRDGGGNGANGGLDDDDDELPPLVRAIDIPELADIVVSHLEGVGDLKNLRLVSKRWRDVSLDKWRKTAVFSLNTEEAENALKLTLGINEGHRFPASTPTIYRFQDKPFKQYRLKKGQIFPPELPSLEHELYFWEKCAPSITYLHLPECFFKKRLDLEGLNWILSYCPNLEELKFLPYSHYIDTDEEENYITECAFLGGVGQPAYKLKSLAISYPDTHLHTGTPHFETISLSKAFFSLIPNLSTLAIRNVNLIHGLRLPLYDHAKGSSKELQLKPFIHLKKFSAIRSEPTTIILKELAAYLTLSPELKTFQFPLKFSEILEDPSRLRKPLKSIKDHVEEIDLKLLCDDGEYLMVRWEERVEEPLKPNSCFDLFNMRFPQLTKLSLVFEYTSNDYAKFLSFDFGMLRGTPNLKYFRFEATRECCCSFVVEKLRVQDLVKNGKEQSWHRMLDGEERRNLWDVEGDVQEEEEEFLPHEEIVLDKMEEFHYEGAFDAEALRFLGQAMKNLKVLETVLDEKTFPVPFQVWGGKNLRKLTALTMTKDALDEHVIAEQQRKYPKVEIKKELPRMFYKVSLSSKELKALRIRPTYTYYAQAFYNSSSEDDEYYDSDDYDSEATDSDSSNSDHQSKYFWF